MLKAIEFIRLLKYALIINASNIYLRHTVNIILLLCAILLGSISNSASASHFRYAHLSWEPNPAISPTAVDFSLTVAFRRCGYNGSGPDGCPVIGDIISENIGATVLQFGDGTSAPNSGYMLFQVTSYNVDEDWIIVDAYDPNTGTNLISHQYPTSNNSGQPWIAAIDTCCRIGNISNSASSYRVETLVNLDTSIGSPISNLPPVLACQTETLCNFFVPAANPGSDTLTWRLATPAESGILENPSGLQVNADTGKVSWNTQGLGTQSL